VWRRCLETGEPYHIEYRLRHRSGQYRWVIGRAQCVRDGEGRIQRWYGTCTDVHDLKVAEAALRDLNANLEQRVADALAERKLWADIFESTDALIAVMAPGYRYLAINTAYAREFEAIFGVRPTVGSSLLDLLADQPEHQEAARAIWDRALAGETFAAVEEFGDPDRKRPFYELRFGALRDRKGTLVAAFQYGQDVTERLRSQAQLLQTEEALRQAQKMEAVGQLTGGVAHDFNNLLTIIKSSTDLLRRPDLVEERRKRYVDAISDTVDRASRLTGQLLAFARRQALKPEVFDVTDRLHAVTDMLRTVLGSRVSIIIDIECDRCFVEADAAQFETALVNMAVNARDAMDGEGTLTIRVDPLSSLPSIRGHAASQAEFVGVSMTDTGTGIAPEKLSHIFEPFFTTKEVGKGTGLGLSQVYGFAKQSGGDVAVESEVGQGTTFTLYLPRASEPAEVDAPAREHVQPAGGRGRRVLVVEDNMEVGRFSTQILEDLGYETTWAANGHEALQRLEEGQAFDVVFSDVVMPGMTGIELGQEIRRRYPQLPVVLTSGYSHVLAEEGRHGFELLQKPYAVEELSRTLRRVSAGTAPSRAAP
jgi:signal transduction histidine kinase/ActR/RegA family two-component response regulator